MHSTIAIGIRQITFVLIFSGVVQAAFGQYAISGKILEEKTGAPVEQASVVIDDHELWAITNEKGEFLIKKVPKGDIRVSIFCLGYAKRTISLNVSGNQANLVFYLPQDNLLIEEVVVTAQRKDDASSSYLIDRKGLEHIQMLSVSDAMGLLPGASTNPKLHLATSSSQEIALRAVSSTDHTAAFGTAIEVDGVRLSTNASFSIQGVDTRNIASSNVSSIEVITGIPSVEYGDLTNGVVKINTRKGKSPVAIDLVSKPNTKQAAVNKGFELGKKAGVLNAGLEYTKSVSDLASPYTSYDRNTLSLVYSNTFNRSKGNPLTLETGLTGNVGGFYNQSDPDKFSSDYTRVKDNTLRGNAKLNWLLHRPWITNLEATASVSYTDNTQEISTRKSSSIGMVSIRGQEEGYFGSSFYGDNPAAPVVIVFPDPSGYWDVVEYNANKPLNIKAALKARWVRKFGKTINNFLLGVEWSSSGNKGRGLYYKDLGTVTDNYREYRYDEVPFTNNAALYLEEKINIPIQETHLQFVAGLRSDYTSIRHSAYGTVGSLSPRLNAKYSFPENRERFVRRVDLRAGWGKAVKLPSFGVLYSKPYYSEIFTFQGGTFNQIPYYIYYIRPYELEYNSDLRWQYSKQAEVGVDVKMKGFSVSLTAFENNISDTYSSRVDYTPFTYKMPVSGALDNSRIVAANRQFSVDRQTGIVTISDKTGQYPDEVLPYLERNTFKSHSMSVNGSPSVRRGLEWIIDVNKIQALQTSFRVDGHYYYYREVDETLSASLPAGNMNDNTPYKYVGYYVGGKSSYNGSETKQLTSNLTVTTHIPAIRLIVSLRLEGNLYYSHLYLSEYAGGQRGFLLDSKDAYLPSAESGSIYNRDKVVALYPLYYTSHEDMETKIPFAEKLIWAYENDRSLYNELTKMVAKSNNAYLFNTNRISDYYSANLSVTKEIGNIASITFNAMNFLNTMRLVKMSWNNTQESAFENAGVNIPNFYYGLSLKIKL